MDKTPAPTLGKVALVRDMIAQGHSAETLLEAFKAAAVLHGLPPELGAASFRGCLQAAAEELKGRSAAQPPHS